MRFTPFVRAAVSAGCLIVAVGCVKVTSPTRPAGGTAVAPVLTGVPIDLRGPEPRAGSVYRVRQRVTMTDARMTLTANGVAETGAVDSLFESDTECETLAVEGGRVTHLREKVITEKETRTLRAGGEAHTDEQPSTLTGETVESRKTGGVWTITLAGKEPTQVQKEELHWYPPPSFYRELLPARPVAVGESWELPPADLRRMFGSHFRVTSGRWKMTFAAVVEVNGERCAEITEEIEVRGETDDRRAQNGGWLRLSGTTTRSLASGRTISSRFEGRAEETSEYDEKGTRVKVVTAGPVRFDTTHEYR